MAEGAAAALAGNGSPAPAAPPVAPTGDPNASGTGVPAEPTNPPAGGPEGGQPAWYKGFPDEVQAVVQAKGWRGPQDAIESYRALERLHGAGADQLLRLPKDQNDTEGWGQVYQRLGRPEKPEGYELDKLETEVDPELGPKFAEMFHVAGLSKAQATQLIERFNGTLTELGNAREETAKAEREAAESADLETLQKEWGKGYDEGVVTARKAAIQLGIDEAKSQKLIDALGAKETFSLFRRIGEAIGEHRPPSTESAPFQNSPAAAQAKIKELSGDPSFMDKVVANPTGPEGKQWTDLHREAFPG